MDTKSKLKFIIDMGKFSLQHPDAGLEFIQWYYNVRKDRKQQVHSFNDVELKVNDLICKLFPNENISLNEMSKNLESVQKYVTDFFNNVTSKTYPSKEKPYPIEYSMMNDSSFLLYVICKITKPSIIVETGVAYGLSSLYILQALNENEQGQLYSIDYSFRPCESREMIGAAIPTHLRSRWNFIYGIASKKLKNLNLNSQIDIFIHDDAHVYKNMMLEFKLMWPLIRKGGFLISDDILSNNAFYDFCMDKKVKPMILSEGQESKRALGIIRKP